MRDKDPAHFMNLAYQEAMKAFDEGEVPVGAVIAKDGAILGRGYNRVEQLRDATAHAEIIAIGAAAQSAGSWRLDGCTLYATLEPCAMCLGAIMLSRIGVVVYGAPDPRMGAIDTFNHRPEIERSYRWFPQVTPGIMAPECGGLLTSFFRRLRKKS
jgi:tRNA(adenine34) deaminase